MKKLFSILFTVMLSAAVYAQAPQKMSCQAVVRNQNNVLVINTLVGMRISILQGAGFTGLALGVSNISSGHGYIQATQVAGSLSGDLLLNPNGGQVGIGYTNQTSVQFPLDINQNGEDGIRLKYENDNWDISSWLGLNFKFYGIQKAYIGRVDGAYVQLSDARLKKDIVQMGSVLDKVIALKPKDYKYISNENSKDADKISTGFIAQEVMPLFPNLVSDSEVDRKDFKGKTVYHGVNYAGFFVVAIKATGAATNNRNRTG